jgi:hypothetical protein
VPSALSLLGGLVAVFGTSAWVCASLAGGWPSPAMFVLGTLALPFLLLVAAAPVLLPVGGMLLAYKAVDQFVGSIGTAVRERHEILARVRTLDAAGRR